MAGSAVATMVWSIEDMNKPMETMAKTSLRRPSGSAPSTATRPVCAISPAALMYRNITCLPASIQTKSGERHGCRTRGPVARGHPQACPAVQRDVHGRGPDAYAVLRPGTGPRPRPAGPGGADGARGAEPDDAVADRKGARRARPHPAAAGPERHARGARGGDAGRRAAARTGQGAAYSGAVRVAGAAAGGDRGTAARRRAGHGSAGGGGQVPATRRVLTAAP